MNISVRPLQPEDVESCEQILGGLSDWFALEESNRDYIDSLSRFPSFVAASEGRVVGFLSLQEYGGTAAEIYMLAVRRDLHRRGIGRQLLRRVEEGLKARGFHLLHAKTRGPSKPDPAYARTQAFYRGLGFLPLFETTAFWGAQNPTLLLVKPLSQETARETDDTVRVREPSEQEVLVQFAGTGDAFGSGGRFQTCILVRSAETSFLIDCGASSLIALKRVGMALSDLDAILLTHLHGDHFGGLPFFMLEAQFISKRTSPLVIAGPPGGEERLERAMEVLFPRSSRIDWNFELRFVEIPPRTTQSLPFIDVTAVPVVHESGASAYALRVQVAGRTIAYSGDTEWTENLIEASADADLFICECSSFDRASRFHLAYETIDQHRSELSCRRLILTHMNRDMLSRLEDVEIETASDGMIVSL